MATGMFRPCRDCAYNPAMLQFSQRCRRCHLVKPLAEFDRRANGAPTPRCTLCLNELAVVHAERTAARIAAKRPFNRYR